MVNDLHLVNDQGSRLIVETYNFYEQVPAQVVQEQAVKPPRPRYEGKETYVRDIDGMLMRQIGPHEFISSGERAPMGWRD